MNGYGYTGAVQPVSEETARLVRIAQYILFATAFVNLTTKDDDILVLAAYANIAAIILILVAVFREAKEQEVAPGVTTVANRQKIIGTIISLIANLILTAALLREVAIKKQTGTSQVFIPPQQPATGAFSVAF